VGRAERAGGGGGGRPAALGVERGDRVVAYMPNIRRRWWRSGGGVDRRIWSSAAPEFGARSVIDRFAQIEPKVLLAVDGYRTAQGLRPHAVVEGILEELPTVEHTVVLHT